MIIHMVFELILKSLYLLAPAGFANMSAKVAAHFGVLKFLDKPIDFGKTYRGYRITGDHKTFRGYVAAIITGVLFGYIQHLLYSYSSFRDISLLDYSNLSYALFIGLLLSLGAMVGDTVKSFFKRQMNVAPGKSWFPFDQIDFILGAFLFVWPFISIDGGYMAISLAVFFVGHVLVNITAYFLGMNESWI
jgi:CDP-2,3-bis-(O-geranylgeranyl)-sn-glycerol synthase